MAALIGPPTLALFLLGRRRSGTRQRFGAIGEHGSIALVERCIRTLKDEGVRRSLAPIRWRSAGRELSLFADCHNDQRPHGGLGGATPDEVYFGRRPAHHGPRCEPRPGVQLALDVGFMAGRAHLPIVTLTRAA